MRKALVERGLEEPLQRAYDCPVVIPITGPCVVSLVWGKFVVDSNEIERAGYGCEIEHETKITLQPGNPGTAVAIIYK